MKWTKLIALNAASISLAYLGAIGDVTWAGNLFVFYQWCMVLLSIASYIYYRNNEELRAKIREKGLKKHPGVGYSKARKTFGSLCSIAVMGILAASGWFFMAVLAAIESCLDSAIVYETFKQEEDNHE